MKAEIIILPLSWIIMIILANGAVVPLWHEAMIAVNQTAPAFVPLLSNPLMDVFLGFILPSFLLVLYVTTKS